ncbi:MAG: hypothetical protein ACLQRH_17945 [Acidimicrobiales bacterium]
MRFSIGSDRKNGVVPAARRMHYGDAVGHPRPYAATSSPFEDHHNGSGQAARSRRSTNSFDERTGCSRSIPPPAVRPGPNHVCSIDEEHCSSITGHRRIGAVGPEPTDIGALGPQVSF